jgi:transcription elongation GreA/GreB family factor
MQELNSNNKAITKKQVRLSCMNLLQKRIQELNEIERSAQESAAGDTKSSMGDKHETSRELLQQEREMAGRRMAEAIRQKEELERILPEHVLNQVQTGALVETSIGTFFFATALGFITVQEKKIAVLSIASPIGQALKEKQLGDIVSFQNKDIRIISIA